MDDLGVPLFLKTPISTSPHHHWTTWHHIQPVRQSSCRCDVDMGQTRSCCTGGVGWGHGRSWMRPPGCYNHEINGQTYITGQMIAISHDLTWKGSWGREILEIPLFQENLGWWNIIIWPDKWVNGVKFHTPKFGCVLIWTFLRILPW